MAPVQQAIEGEDQLVCITLHAGDRLTKESPVDGKRQGLSVHGWSTVRCLAGSANTWAMQAASERPECAGVHWSMMLRDDRPIASRFAARAWRRHCARCSASPLLNTKPLRAGTTRSSAQPQASL